MFDSLKDYAELAFLFGGACGLTYGLISSIEESYSSYERIVLSDYETANDFLRGFFKTVAYGCIGAIVSPTLPLYLLYSSLVKK